MLRLKLGVCILPLTYMSVLMSVLMSVIFIPLRCHLTLFEVVMSHKLCDIIVQTHDQILANLMVLRITSYLVQLRFISDLNIGPILIIWRIASAPFVCQAMEDIIPISAPPRSSISSDLGKYTEDLILQLQIV